MDWYDGLENDLLDASHEEYTSYQKQLDLYSSHLDSLLSDSTNTLDLLTSLSDSFKSVETQTTSFQKQCEGLTREQKRLTQLADEITQNLKYYSFLEPVTRRLNAPGAGSLVRSQEFSSMLARLDECLEYMAVHPEHREASTYRSRYRMLMTRGLTLIRVNFVNGLKDISSDVMKRIAERQLNDTTMSALLYAKFRVGASELKEVVQEIRKRTVRAPGANAGGESEYLGLMNELYANYSATRAKLIIPWITKKIRDVAVAPSTSKELVPFARNSISYMREMCTYEYDLWREWFDGEDGLYDFLESACEPLYDELRPRIIHENEILKLCELCTLLQTRYMHDQDDDEPLAANELDFSVLIQPALEDAQTRLVFRTQAILRDEIERYKPKPDVLDYPACNRKVSLSGSKNQRSATSGRKISNAEPTTPMPKTPMIVEGGDSLDGQWGFDTQAAFQGWYPTLRKAIWLLSRIYRLVNSTVFDDLAHQIVHQTTLSLHHASTLISTNHTRADGHLFLIKHLLILKQQIVAFDIEYVVTPDINIDFSGVTNTFYELRERGGFFDPRNLWKRMGGNLLPKVVENMLDAKVELDGRLRGVITDFTTGSTDRITNPITETAAAKKGFDPLKAVNQIKAITEKEVPLLRKKLDEYLDDRRTKETLVSAVQDLVVQRYETFYEGQMRGKHGESGSRRASKKGKGREDEVWDVDMFEEWAGGVFRVGKVLGREEEGEQDDDDGFMSDRGSGTVSF
ncbi:Golgi transport complex subunit 3 [Xanthoria calcicola]